MNKNVNSIKIVLFHELIDMVFTTFKQKKIILFNIMYAKFESIYMKNRFN